MSKLGLSLLLLLWMGGSSWYYVCKIKQQCPGTGAGLSKVIDSSSTAGEAIMPLYFTHSSLDPQQTQDFASWKDSIVSLLKGENVLHIKGLYTPGENFTGDHSDPGMERAVIVQELLVGSGYEKDRIHLMSEKLDISSSDSLKRNLFTLDVRPKEKIVVEEVGKMTIFFPTNSIDILQAGEVTDFLDRYSKFLKSNNEKIVIEGNTDNAGTKEHNKSLGLQRANAIKQMLVDRGVDPSRLTVLSNGDTKPAGSNETDQGKSQNRRVELITRK